MRQYARFKAEHPECLLLFRMGDFYELFDDDAVTAHRALGLTLTQRTEGIPMAGVPHHAVETYIRRLIEQGHRVAVCDQVQDPREAKGIVERAVTRVVTPGTLVDEALLDEARPNRVAAVQFLESGDESAAALAVAELSTGQFTVMDLPSGRVIDEVARLAPSEIIHVETADGSTPPRVEALRRAIACALTPRPGWTFRTAEAREALTGHYGVSTLTGFGLEDDDVAVGAAGALLRYLLQTQAPDGGTETMRHLRPPRRAQTDSFVTIDGTSLRSLEIERTMRTGETSGSLLSILQRGRTAMGKRLLREWICFPLRDRASIEARQRMVGVLADDEALADALADELDPIQDVARMAGRLGLGRATPRDIVALGRSLERIAPIAERLEARPAFASMHERLTELAIRLTPLALLIEQRCVDDPPAHLREGGLFRDGVDAELDEARSLHRDASTWLAAYQKRLIEQTAVASLKVGYNRVFGYYIELTAAQADKAPPEFTRKQTLKNAERYITPELKEFEDKITTAEARAVERENLLYQRLCAHAASHAEPLATFGQVIAELDVLRGFGEIARRHGYVRPDLVDEPILDIRQGRHPVLDRLLGERFVPNDCGLGLAGEPCPETGAAARLALITGPNMAGKSTYIRQVAIIVLLAHTGCFVPAESARIGLVDRIFTRVGASDELHAGQSTFMVEMTETANILHHATNRSLVILDEIGRGTSTLDGLSLAWAITESLADVGCRTLFATHYHELTDLADRRAGVTNLHVAVREWGDEIIFVYRILPGRTDRSYGIHVARIAGLPSATVRRATELLEKLAVHTEGSVPAVPASAPAPAAQLSLFTEFVDHPILAQVRALDLNRLTPLQAFDELRRWQGQLDPDSKPATPP
ncbi:MAG: DNA mismatch repair protein MutS [Planctomycetota bacterium]|jgi:DNA mismatch repair protein MutS